MDTQSGISDEAYQQQVLPYVSRTFALTIPQLPAPLRTPVVSAYLLCRIADTIEDEPAIPPDDKLALLSRFAAVVAGTEDAAPLAGAVAPRFSEATLPAEADLARNMERVIRVLNTFSSSQRAAISRCVTLMCHGMPQFQLNASVRGLAYCGDLDDYCYYVAGVVGEMLTELFCGYSPVMGARRQAMGALAVSFAQGLQMTNILKDVWEDRSRGACWLPQELFSRHGVDLGDVQPDDPRFQAGYLELVAVAHGHLRNALAYTLLVPPDEPGIRRFCLWAIGLAVLTLRRIQAHPGFTSGREVKVSRRAVMATRILTNLALRNDMLLRGLFKVAASGLPFAPGKSPQAALHSAPPAQGSHSSQSATPAPHTPDSPMTTDYSRPAMRAHVGGARRPDGSSMQ
jgi:farnesyl-diphosphate farnesyltransferase